MRTTIPYISLVLVLLSSFLAKSTSAQAVSVASFSPVSQIAGKTIAVTGSNFASTGMTVTVGGTSASYSFSSSSLIVVTIPTGAQSGSISVNRSGFTTGSKSGFIFIETIDRMITDYNGYWSSTIQSNNSTLPDLSHNLLTFKFGSTLYSNIQLELYDLQGRLMDQPKFDSSESMVILDAQLTSGIYFLTVHTNSESKSILIKKED